MSHNPITGDRIATKPSKTYADNWERIFKGGKKPNERIAERLRAIIDGKEKQDTSWCGKRDSSVMKPDASLVAIRESACCPMCDVVEIDEAPTSER